MTFVELSAHLAVYAAVYFVWVPRQDAPSRAMSYGGGAFAYLSLAVDSGASGSVAGTILFVGIGVSMFARFAALRATYKAEGAESARAERTVISLMRSREEMGYEGDFIPDAYSLAVAIVRAKEDLARRNSEGEVRSTIDE